MQLTTSINMAKGNSLYLLETFGTVFGLPVSVGRFYRDAALSLEQCLLYTVTVVPQLTWPLSTHLSWVFMGNWLEKEPCLDAVDSFPPSACHGM